MSENDGFLARLAPPDSAADSTEVGILIEAFNADASTTAAESLDHRKIFWQRRIAILRRAAVRTSGLESELDATRGDLDATRGELEATRRDLEATRRDLDATGVDLASTQSELAVTRGNLDAARHAEYLQLEATKRAEDELGGYRQHAANLEELLKSLQARHDQLARNLAEMTESRAWQLSQLCSRAVRRLRSLFRKTPRASS